MVEITRIIEWDMGHRVPNHFSKCRNPHGHRYRMEVTVRGRLDRREGASTQGMVWDFGLLKKIMMERVHDILDHGFMVWEKDELLCDFFQGPAAEFRHLIVPFVPTAENIAFWAYHQIAPHLPQEIVLVRVRIFETPNSWADYIPREEC
ncbi:MAG: 6-carboxytetrahydropterin synthase [Lentisphaerae bacterium]|nr:MAG: 6-carboxytetrahydropterin synthase [Lentisphaerota bacterium]